MSEAVVVRAEDVQAVHPVDRAAANVVLSRLCHKGWLRRIRLGTYALVPLESTTTRPAIEDALSLAMELFAPCYIPGWSAAEHWDLTEQIFNSVSVVTGHPQRSSTSEYGGVTFRTRQIDPARIFGTKRIWLGSRAVELADPHRLVLDRLDAPDFGGGGRHTLDVVLAYWHSELRSEARLLDYAIRFQRGAALKRLGFIAELAGVASAEWLQDLEQQLTGGVALLDPSSGTKGKVSSRWRVRINLPLSSA